MLLNSYLFNIGSIQLISTQFEHQLYLRYSYNSINYISTGAAHVDNVKLSLSIISLRTAHTESIIQAVSKQSCSRNCVGAGILRQENRGRNVCAYTTFEKEST